MKLSIPLNDIMLVPSRRLAESGEDARDETEFLAEEKRNAHSHSS